MLTLVTGSTGLLGNNVVRKLLDKGESVRVLVRQSSPSKALEGLKVETVVGDLDDAASIEKAMHDVQQVVHSAGFVKIGWGDLDTARKVNVDGTRRVAEAARKAEAKMVHVSTVNTLGLGSPQNPADEETPPENQIECSYVVTKKEAEAVVLKEVDRGLQAMIVNPGFMLGPWDWKPSSGQMLLDVATRFTPYAPEGGCSVADVRDVSHGILSALDSGKPGRRYVLAGENVTYLELWQSMARVAKASAPKSTMGPIIKLVAGMAGDMKRRLTGKEPLINSAAIKMSNQFHYYSSNRARTELGYRIRPTRDAIEDAWDWFVRHGYLGKH